MRPVTYDYGAAQSGEPSREQTDQSRANIVIPVRSSLVLKLVDCACLGPTQIGEENLKGVSLSYLRYIQSDLRSFSIRSQHS